MVEEKTPYHLDAHSNKYFARQHFLKWKEWWFWFNPLKCFFGSEGHVALVWNPGTGYNTLLLRMIPGDLLSAFPHRQFHTLPGLLDSWAALPNSYPNALHAMKGGSLYHFYDGLWWINKIWSCDPLSIFLNLLLIHFWVFYVAIAVTIGLLWQGTELWLMPQRLILDRLKQYY